MNEIQNLNPKCIWRNFYALTQVPRPSGHLEKIQQFLLDFGKQAGVEVFKDPAGPCREYCDAQTGIARYGKP